MTAQEHFRLQELANAVQCVVLTKVPIIKRCPTACAVMNQYLGEAVRTGKQGLITVEGCLAIVLTEVLKEHESLVLRFGSYIAKFGQTQTGAEVRK